MFIISPISCGLSITINLTWLPFLDQRWNLIRLKFSRRSHRQTVRCQRWFCWDYRMIFIKYFSKVYGPMQINSDWIIRLYITQYLAILEGHSGWTFMSFMTGTITYKALCRQNSLALSRATTPTGFLVQHNKYSQHLNPWKNLFHLRNRNNLRSVLI